MSDIKDLNNEEVKDVAGDVTEDELLKHIEPKGLKKPIERYDRPDVPYEERKAMSEVKRVARPEMTCVFKNMELSPCTRPLRGKLMQCEDCRNNRD